MNKTAVKFLTNLISVKKYRKMKRELLCSGIDESLLKRILSLEINEYTIKEIAA